MADLNQKTQQTPPKPTVMLIRILGNRYSEHFLRSWTELLGYCLTHNIRPILANICETPFFIQKNKCLRCDMHKGKEQVPLNGEMDYDYVLWISGGCVFTTKTLQRLLDMNREVSSASSLMKHNVNCFNFITDINYEENKSYSFVERDKVKAMVEQGTEECKVDYVDMNFVLMKKGVLETIQYPWFGGDHDNLNGETLFFQKCKEHTIDVYVDLKEQVCIENTVIL